MKSLCLGVFFGACSDTAQSTEGQVGLRVRGACYRGSSAPSCPRSRLGSPQGLWGLSALGSPRGFPQECLVGSDRAKLKVADLRWRSPICGNLRFPAKICGFLRKSCALHMLEFPGERVNLRNLRFGFSLSPQFRALQRAQI